MGNTQAGEVDVEVGGQRLVFRLGINELIAIQADWGLADKDAEFFAELDALQQTASLKKLRSVFYHGMRRGKPDVTEEAAGDLLVALGLKRAGELLSQALRWAAPEKSPEGEGSGGEPRPSGGPTSTPTRPERASRRTR